jgi:hypothetical protein
MNRKANAEVANLGGEVILDLTWRIPANEMEVLVTANHSSKPLFHVENLVGVVNATQRSTVQAEITNPP